MPLRQPRPGYQFWVADSEYVTSKERHGGVLWADADNRNEDALPANDINDLGGSYIADARPPSEDREYVEVLEILHERYPVVAEAAERPPFGLWHTVEEFDVPEPPEWLPG